MSSPKSAAPGTFATPPEDLTKAPPKLRAFGQTIDQRPQLAELRKFFDDFGPFPDQVPVDWGVLIIDVGRFLGSHLPMLDWPVKPGADRNDPDYKTKARYYYRLVALKAVLEKSVVLPANPGRRP